MVISGFWGFATIFVLAVVILAIKFSTKCEEETYSDNGTIIKRTFYEFGWRFNKENKD